MKDKYREETNLDVYDDKEQPGSYTDDYVRWLEYKAFKLEQVSSLLLSYFLPTDPASTSNEMFERRMKIIEILNVPEDWDKFDYQTKRYSFDDLIDIFSELMNRKTEEDERKR